MRVVAAVDTFFPDAPGGMARVAWDVAAAMARRGHEIVLVAGDGQARSREAAVTEELVDGVRVIRYPKPSMSAWDPWRAQKQIADCAAAIRSVLRRFSSDVIHCHSIFTAGAAAMVAGGVPLLQTVHSPAIQEILYNWKHQGFTGEINRIFGTSAVRSLEAEGLRKSTCLHALSRYTVSQMQREFPSHVDNFTVIPHWANQEWFRTISKEEARHRLGWPQDERIVFTVRQLRHRYGIDTAIEAIAPLARAQRCQFMIGGAGSDYGSLESQIRKLECADRIRMLGRLSDEHLRWAYQAADLFVLPTRALECFGLIIVEALACGLPVVATSVGAIPENMSPILPDFLVPPDDPPALGEKVSAFLDGRLQAPSEEALIRHAKEHFGEQAIVDCYEDLFRRAAQERI